MNRTALFVLGCAGLALASCKKDDDSGTTTKKDLVTSSAWKIDRVGLDLDGNGSIDTEIPEGYGLEACELDNTFSFKSDSTGVLDEGASKCDDSDPQTSPFEWYLKNNEEVLFITGDIPEELEGDIKILAVTGTSFRLSKTISLSDPIPLETNLVIELKK